MEILKKAIEYSVGLPKEVSGGAFVAAIGIFILTATISTGWVIKKDVDAEKEVVVHYPYLPHLRTMRPTSPPLLVDVLRLTCFLFRL